MIYRILDAETNEYNDLLMVDQENNIYDFDSCFRKLDDPQKYKIEWGFKYNKKCYYENDIIEVIDEDGNKTKHVIINEAHVGYPAFDLKPSIGEVYNSFSIMFFTCDNDYTCKVIGNFNQNPELLER